MLGGALALAGRPRDLVRYIAWGLPALAFLGVYDAIVFGSPIAQSYPGVPWDLAAGGHLGLLLSPSRGLLVYSPFLVLALIWWARAWTRRTETSALLRSTSIGALALWLVYGAYRDWWGGWVFGSRYLLLQKSAGVSIPGSVVDPMIWAASSSVVFLLLLSQA